MSRTPMKCCLGCFVSSCWLIRITIHRNIFSYTDFARAPTELCTWKEGKLKSTRTVTHLSLHIGFRKKWWPFHLSVAPLFICIHIKCSNCLVLFLMFEELVAIWFNCFGFGCYTVYPWNSNRVLWTQTLHPPLQWQSGEYIRTIRDNTVNMQLQKNKDMVIVMRANSMFDNQRDISTRLKRFLVSVSPAAHFDFW